MRLPRLGRKVKKVQAAFVANLGAGRFDGGVGVALVAIGEADALSIFIELGGVEGAGEEVLEDDRIGDADRLQVLHRAAQVEAAEVLIAGELDLADFDRRAFLDVEVDLHRGGRNGLDVGLDGGELMAVLGEQFREDVLRAHHLGGIVLALNGETDLLLLEAIEDVGGRDGAVALVIDLANGGAFADEDVEDDALLRIFALDAQVLKVAGVPEGVEVALDARPDRRYRRDG